MSTEQGQQTIRCLVAKAGLDGHDRGAHFIARSFRDCGLRPPAISDPHPCRQSRWPSSAVTQY